MIKARHDERAALLATAPAVYEAGWATNPTAWVTVRLEHGDPDEVWELLEEAWRMTTTKRAIRAREGQARGFGSTGPFPDCSGLSMRHDEAEAITDQLTGVVYERALSPAERAEFAELVGSVGSRILG